MLIVAVIFLQWGRLTASVSERNVCETVRHLPAMKHKDALREKLPKELHKGSTPKKRRKVPRGKFTSSGLSCLKAAFSANNLHVPCSRNSSRLSHHSCL